MPLSLEDATDAYPEMRFIVENEAHLRRKSMHCFLNLCASLEENINIVFLQVLINGIDGRNTQTAVKAVNS